MAPVLLTQLIDRGIQLHAQIALLSEELKTINGTLRAHALEHSAEHVPLTDPTREGTRLLCQGTQYLVPVVCTTDQISQTFPPESELHTKLLTLAGDEDRLRALYQPVTTWQAVHLRSNKFDGGAFRRVARELLPDPERFIAAAIRRNKDGLPVSAVKVEWDAASPHPDTAPPCQTTPTPATPDTARTSASSPLSAPANA